MVKKTPKNINIIRISIIKEYQGACLLVPFTSQWRSLLVKQASKKVIKMINQKQIMVEWQKAGLKINGFTNDDVNDIYDHLVHNSDSEVEAHKIFILAIRKAAKNGATTQWAVSNNANSWVQAGLTNAQAVGDYERESQQIQQKGRYGQPIKQENKILAPTSDEIQQQNERWAKELGYESVEATAKGTHDILINLRKTRAERLASKPKTGLTANGNQVLKRF